MKEQSFLEDFEDKEKKEPPYGYLVEHIKRFMKDVPEINPNLRTCHQCAGSGYDSKAAEAAPCCSCYGMGKLFTKNNEPVDYKKQRDLVKKLRDMIINQDKSRK